MAIKLRLDFDAWFEFVPAFLRYQFEIILMLSTKADVNMYWSELT